MRTAYSGAFYFITSLMFLHLTNLNAQDNSSLKYENPSLYSGIEVGSKGVKMSLLEIGKNSKSNGTFNVLKDTSVNTDFISFSSPTFQATLNGFSDLYTIASKDYNISPGNIFTVISSGVQMQAAKEEKNEWIRQLIDSFKLKIKEPQREVEVIDALQEARLSHLGIVPDSKRFSTFLIDIGSGNTKGGYFPYDNTKDFKLFNLDWGTKSTGNAAEKRCDEFDKTLVNYNKQLYRVLVAAEEKDIVYAVNASGAYNMNDYIAFSGGIAWAVATLIRPEAYSNSIVPVTYDDVINFSETLYKNYSALSDADLVKTIEDNWIDKGSASKEIRRVHKVFDQRSMMAGTGLLLKIMRQFKSIYETKQFYLVKNGQVGWISAYVDQHAGQ
ncbi:MAG: hypothetical protein ACSLE0_10625 [Chitinophagaceae bacterium]